MTNKENSSHLKAEIIRAGIRLICDGNLAEPWDRLSDSGIIRKWKRDKMPFVDPILQACEDLYPIRGISNGQETTHPPIPNGIKKFWLQLSDLSDAKTEKGVLLEGKRQTDFIKFLSKLNT